MESGFKTSYRTHNNGELTDKDNNIEVKLCGWIQSKRDHGGLIFVDLRDRYGITQVVIDPKNRNFKDAEHLRREDYLQIKGMVRLRPKEMFNLKLITGKIEVLVSELNIVTKADIIPIEIEDRVEASEEVRLKYRYLDLRRPIMQKRLMLRHKIITTAREFFNKNNFIEITTPLLVKSTPEGARDYVVPSRVHAGKFYALPQSPQLYKQLLMISGFDRYYQIAVCLRDEDLRMDRQPEHTQFDLEMSCVKSEDIRDFVENLYKYIFKEVLRIELNKFQIITYKEAMENYGSDKPDLRFDLKITDATDIVKNCEFNVFKEVVKNGGSVRCINPEKEFSRNEIDAYINFSQELGAKGMVWMKLENGNLESNIAKYFSKEQIKQLIEKTKIKKGYLFFIADKTKKTFEILGKLRLKLRDDLKLVEPETFKFCWVKDFPLFAWNEDENRWEPEHHMFTNPKEEYITDFEKRPGEVIGDLWDLVLNGIELGSGSIRVTKPELQRRIMKFIGLDEHEANKRFGFLLEAYKYGAPIHGGMGLGIDRLTALMAGINDIREVIAFPKNKAAQCPMDECPSDITEKQLKELHIKTEIVKK